MKFEHLVEINNPADGRIIPLNRQQLWQGLVLRAEEPMLFIPQMDSCFIVDRVESGITRRLTFGKLVVKDHVEYVFEEQVRFIIPEQTDILESRLEMTIEEPEPGRFFVRFTYEDSAPEEGPEAIYNDYRRSAYREADIDTIRTIRQFAATGRFDR